MLGNLDLGGDVGFIRIAFGRHNSLTPETLNVRVHSCFWFAMVNMRSVFNV